MATPPRPVAQLCAGSAAAREAAAGEQAALSELSSAFGRRVWAGLLPLVQPVCCQGSEVHRTGSGGVANWIPRPSSPPSFRRSLLADLSFSFVVSCARSADMPIVFASPQFYTCTGYTPGEVLGRNCRFLQGEAPLQAGGTPRRRLWRQRH